MRLRTHYLAAFLLTENALALFGQSPTSTTNGGRYWMRLGGGYAVEQENCGTCPTPDLVSNFGCFGAIAAGLRLSRLHPALHLGIELGAWKEYAWQSQVQKTYTRTLVVDYAAPGREASRWRARFGLGAARHFPTNGDGNTGTTLVAEAGVGHRGKTFTPMLVAYHSLAGGHDATATHAAGPYRPFMIALVFESLIE